MLKLEIGFDEERILKDGKYDLDAMYKYLDKLFIHQGLQKDCTTNKSVFYKGTGKNTDMAAIFSCVFHLEKKDWFMEYVNLWLLYDNENTTDEENYEIEDILIQSRKKLANLGKAV